jgi:two-component system, chemotaxis family, sensor kinase CheA
MAQKENGFFKKLFSTFKIEAEEHISAMSSGLIALEKAQAAEKRMQIVETVFREAHSLKGAARSVNMAEIEETCQALEGIFASLKRRELALSPELFDVLHKAVNSLTGLIFATGTEDGVAKESDVQKLIKQLDDAARGLVPKPERRERKGPAGKNLPTPAPLASSPSAHETPVLAETVRIATAKLDALLVQTEELLSAKQAARRHLSDLSEMQATFAVWEKEWAKIRPGVRTIEKSFAQDGKGGRRAGEKSQVIRLLEFLEWNSNFVKSLQRDVARIGRTVAHHQRTLGSMVDSLLEDTKKTLMLPFSMLLEIFPKLVRDLSRDRGKEVALVIQGDEIEIDRRILEEMKDPLIHLVRNCIDHGIEKPGEREGLGKAPAGALTIAVSQEDSGKVEVLIVDDGAGIELGKVRSAAARLGLISQDEARQLNEQETLSLIFQSGVSTSPIITDISGRGLGLAIVREKVENLGGVISAATHAQKGTTFRISLPLTLSAFRGILVRVDERRFVLPSRHVERVLRVGSEKIKTVENRETLELGGQAVSVVRLGDVLELPRNAAAFDSGHKAHALVLASADRRIAFLVDEILDEQEVLVKSLGNQLSRVRNITGATVLGTGEVVPILNVADLLRSAVKVSRASAGIAPAAPQVKPARQSILVVEDSITARTLLKNIMETAGYQVKTAVDGIDALAALRTEDFDLVVSDVDMPRMNGFELTAKIRTDKKLADLPVVLVTALQSREDRERGVDAGANAYIVKTNFDQSNLLETVRRLI